MFRTLRLLFGLIFCTFRTRRWLLLEIVALRQQLAVLKANCPRPQLTSSDRVFWMVLQKLWSGWKQSLIIVQPDTVLRWHRAGFKVYWTWLSRHQAVAGRKSVSREVRDLIIRMVAENRTWGAPRIHGELKMLGFDISEATVLRWMRKAPRDHEPAKRWTTFLDNHREAIAAMDFFTVPTLTFGMIYCFFVISHRRRCILHFGVTQNPTGAWVSQQLREAFPYDSAAKYLIFDRGSNFDKEVVSTIKNFGIEPKRTSFRSPWQNGLAERFVGSCRRDLLDHVIVLNERHLKRLMTEYVRYYHNDRTHLGLDKLTPGCRVAMKRGGGGRVIACPGSVAFIIATISPPELIVSKYPWQALESCGKTVPVPRLLALNLASAPYKRSRTDHRREAFCVKRHQFTLGWSFDEGQQTKNPSLQPYGTVRSLFPEGEELYPTAGFWSKTHVQVCVRDPNQILGIFRIPEWQRVLLNMPEVY
jgi:transposase InsO family protein